MNVPSTNLANSSIASFQQLGSPTVGQENAEAKAQALPPVEEAAEGARLLNRRDPGDKQAQTDEQLRLKENAQSSNEQTDTVDADGRRQNSQQDADGDERQQSAKEQQIEQQETQEIAALAARDREVRAHEAAHAAVGGQYAGSPTYTYRRGPNGVNYAIGGEVSISTGGVPGDAQATLRKAQLIQRAALAPADPSAQDRRVAARAAQLALQARVDITAQAAAEARAEAERAVNRRERASETRESDTADDGTQGSRPLRSDVIDPQQTAGLATRAVDPQQAVGLATEAVDPQQAAGLATPAVDPQEVSGLASEAQEISGLASPAIVNVERLLTSMGLGDAILVGGIVDQVV